MIHQPWTRKEIAVAAVVVTLASVVAALSLGLVYPEPISHAELGPDWQCSRLAFVFTTCSRIQRAVAARVPVRNEPHPICPRPPAEPR
jgi:hypothetical protein